MSRLQFWAARIARIYPAYLLAFAIAAPLFISAVAAHHTLSGTLVRIGFGGLTALSLFQAWTPWTAGYWNSPAWSVSVEVFFYLVFPMVVPRLASVALSKFVIGALLLWGFTMAIVGGYAYFGQGTVSDSKIAYAMQCLPVLRLSEFLIGCLVARVFVLDTGTGGLGTLAAHLSSLAIIWIVGMATAIPELLLGNGLLAPLFGVLIWGLAKSKVGLSWLFSLPPIVYLGEISYGLYILQEPVARWASFVTDGGAYTSLYSFFAVLVATAAFSFRFVDRPVGRRLKSLILNASNRA